jgi:hypothetical protein
MAVGPQMFCVVFLYQNANSQFMLKFHIALRASNAVRTPPPPLPLRQQTYTTSTLNFLTKRSLPTLSSFRHIAFVKVQLLKSQTEVQISLSCCIGYMPLPFHSKSSFPCNLPYTVGPDDTLCDSEKYIFVFSVITVVSFITPLFFFTRLIRFLLLLIKELTRHTFRKIT